MPPGFTDDTWEKAYNSADSGVGNEGETEEARAENLKERRDKAKRRWLIYHFPDLKEIARKVKGSG